MCNSAAKKPIRKQAILSISFYSMDVCLVLWTVLVIIHNLQYKNKLSERCVEILKYLNMISKFS